MCQLLKDRHDAFERARAELDRFNASTADALLEPDSEEYVQGVHLAHELDRRFAELAEICPQCADGARLLQQAVLAHLGDVIADIDGTAYQAMQRVAEFLAAQSEHEKKSG